MAKYSLLFPPAAVSEPFLVAGRDAGTVSSQHLTAQSGFSGMCWILWDGPVNMGGHSLGLSLFLFLHVFFSFSIFMCKYVYQHICRHTCMLLYIHGYICRWKSEVDAGNHYQSFLHAIY